MAMQHVEQAGPVERYSGGGVDIGAGSQVHGWADRPSFLRLIQKETAGTPGTWLRTDTGEEYEEVQLVPLRLNRTRRKWEAGEFSMDRKVECWSNDGEVAAPGAKYEGSACAGCAFRRDNIFTMTADEDSRGAACAPTHMAIALIAFTWEPVAINLGNKTLSRMVGALKANMGKNILTYAAPLFRGEKGGEWYSPKLTQRPEPLTEEDKGEVMAALQSLAGITISATDEGEDVAPPAQPATQPQQPSTRAQANGQRELDEARDSIRQQAAPQPVQALRTGPSQAPARAPARGNAPPHPAETFQPGDDLPF